MTSSDFRQCRQVRGQCLPARLHARSRRPTADDELERKLTTYARVGECVVTHRDPRANAGPPQYATVHTHHRGETITALAVDGLAIATDFLLPPMTT